MDFSFTTNGNTVTMNDVMVTLGTATAAFVAWRQKSKDEQIKARDETIEFLKKELGYLQRQLGQKDEEKESFIQYE